jgi:hypothetical protein
MFKRRKRYEAGFKARVALEAVAEVKCSKSCTRLWHRCFTVF